MVDSETFRATPKIKVGAVQITVNGEAHIVDSETYPRRTVPLEAKGKEVGGQGKVRAAVFSRSPG